jgi:hypothetical protein
MVDDGDGDLGLAGTVEVEHVSVSARVGRARLAHAVSDVLGAVEGLDPAQMPLVPKRPAAEPQPQRILASPRPRASTNGRPAGRKTAHADLVARDPS